MSEEESNIFETLDNTRKANVIKNYSVYSIYMLKDFEGTMEDYEIAMEVLFSNVSTYNVHRDWNQTVQEVANG